MYYSYIYPYFDYCVEVWGSACHTRIQQLFLMQKKAIRIITMSGYLDHTEPLFKKCHILTLYEIRILKIIMFMFKVHNKSVPQIFQEYFTVNSAIHNYRTRQRDKLRAPLCKTGIMRNSIRVKGVYLWNYIFDRVQIECTITLFKRNLRNLILSDKAILHTLP